LVNKTTEQDLDRTRSQFIIVLWSKAGACGRIRTSSRAAGEKIAADALLFDPRRERRDS